jgi:hypothetical protein
VTKQRLDWRFLIVLLMTGVIFFAVTLIVHRWQRNTQSSHEAARMTSIPQ